MFQRAMSQSVMAEMWMRSCDTPPVNAPRQPLGSPGHLGRPFGDFAKGCGLGGQRRRHVRRAVPDRAIRRPARSKAAVDAAGAEGQVLRVRAMRIGEPARPSERAGKPMKSRHD
ncbi:hypothetical protein GCM10027203_65650 [Nonomuraea fastidiosa]